MEKHVIREAARAAKEPVQAEASIAEKGLAERALEALLGCAGEDMLARAEGLNRMLAKLEEGGGPDGGAACAED